MCILKLNIKKREVSFSETKVLSYFAALVNLSLNCLVILACGFVFNIAALQ